MWSSQDMEHEEEMFGEMPYGEMSGEQEMYGEMPDSHEIYGEMPGETYGEMPGEMYGESPLNEALEMELAGELLGVTNEQEMDHFLGGLIKKVGGIIKSPVGRALGGILKGVAKKALPLVGGALGSMVAPGIGTAIGSSLGSMAGKMFELELEGMSGEDKEFEVARRFVRLASASARKAATAPSHIPPKFAAKKAVIFASRKHAPGLYSMLVNASRPAYTRPPQVRPAYVKPTPAYTTPYPTVSFGAQTDYWPSYQSYPPLPKHITASGRWVRRGNAIIIYGA